MHQDGLTGVRNNNKLLKSRGWLHLEKSKKDKIVYIVKEEFKDPNMTKEELKKCINKIMERIINNNESNTY